MLAEIVTGMKFTYDCRHLITVSGDRWDVWRLPLVGLPLRVGGRTAWQKDSAQLAVLQPEESASELTLTHILSPPPSLFAL